MTCGKHPSRRDGDRPWEEENRIEGPQFTVGLYGICSDSVKREMDYLTVGQRYGASPAYPRERM